MTTVRDPEWYLRGYSWCRAERKMTASTADEILDVEFWMGVGHVQARNALGHLCTSSVTTPITVTSSSHIVTSSSPRPSPSSSPHIVTFTVAYTDTSSSSIVTSSSPSPSPHCHRRLRRCFHRHLTPLPSLSHSRLHHRPHHCLHSSPP
jgi:hypothetical protein